MPKKLDSESSLIPDVLEYAKPCHSACMVTKPDEGAKDSLGSESKSPSKASEVAAVDAS